MASKKTLNAKNLEALGVRRLAELLIEISTGNAASKRHLRLELSGALGPKEVARDIRKRLSTIARSRSYVEWDRTRALVQDLDTQRSAIVEKVAPKEPEEALELMWRFLGLAASIYERCDDSNGSVGDVFYSAREDLGEIAKAAQQDPNMLADRVFEALQDNGYGQYDNLIPLFSPVLGPDGLAQLKTKILELAENPVPVPPEEEREVVGWGSGGETYAHEMAERSRQSTVRMALMDIADAEGDVDAFIAQYDAKTRKVPKIAANIAERLLAASRAEDAWGFIERAEFGNRGWVPSEWQSVRLDVLEAIGRDEEAQSFRLDCFHSDLAADHLRAYIKRLPDFDDVEAEDEAMTYALTYPSALSALHFLVHWPALDRAAQLVTSRADEIDGNHYETLTPAADALSANYPLAAMLCLRAMIDFALGAARSKRYRHAARHLLECESLAGQIDNFGEIETHATYVASLKVGHGRKQSFWGHLA
ncbi:MAG: hypothetical protein ACI92Z_003238 [Paracoccaceae bacterium]|jgi:hypothetical protein